MISERRLHLFRAHSHDSRNIGIVIEFKKVDTMEHETLEHAAVNALEQIEKKKYVHELAVRGIKNSIKLGIAFAGKQVYIQHA